MRALPLLALLAGGCRIVEAAAKPGGETVSVRVFYGTDRRPTGSSKPEEAFGQSRGDLVLGSCEVSVPRDHRMGALDIVWGRFKPSPQTHVFVLSFKIQVEDEFAADLSRAARDRAAFVFIHGYNVTFHDAVRRTAQMAYDLGFEGAAVAYSWPSKGETDDYNEDERRVRHTIANLERFLTLLARRSGARVVHVVAHSMGNRALVAALDLIAEKRAARFGEVVFAAPDVAADEFEQVFPKLRPAAERFTLYASSKDLALGVSKGIHGGPRAGDSGEGIVVLPGLESIDVSAVDTSFLGHSYYGDNKSVLADLKVLLRDRKGAAARPNLEARSKAGRAYWKFGR